MIKLKVSKKKFSSMIQALDPFLKPQKLNI